MPEFSPCEFQQSPPSLLLAWLLVRLVAIAHGGLSAYLLAAGRVPRERARDWRGREELLRRDEGERRGESLSRRWAERRRRRRRGGGGGGGGERVRGVGVRGDQGDEAAARHHGDASARAKRHLAAAAGRARSVGGYARTLKTHTHTHTQGGVSGGIQKGPCNSIRDSVGVQQGPHNSTHTPGKRLSNEPALLGSVAWYRPGLCQCRFRTGYNGLCRASTARFPPAGAGLRSGSTTAPHPSWFFHVTRSQLLYARTSVRSERKLVHVSVLTSV
jgi:hypothetical protein